MAAKYLGSNATHKVTMGLLLSVASPARAYTLKLPLTAQHGIGPERLH